MLAFEFLLDKLVGLELPGFVEPILFCDEFEDVGLLLLGDNDSRYLTTAILLFALAISIGFFLLTSLFVLHFSFSMQYLTPSTSPLSAKR